MVGAAFGLGHDVVESEVLEGEEDFATVTYAFLLAEKSMLVCAVVGKLADVGAVWDVSAVDKVV